MNNLRFKKNRLASLLILAALCVGMLPFGGGIARDRHRTTVTIRNFQPTSTLSSTKPFFHQMVKVIVETPSAPTRSLLTELSSPAGWLRSNTPT
jgi:hypothetical protein